MEPLLSIKNLSISFHTKKGDAHAVDQVSFEVFPGEAVGLVGESGCGKSVTAQAILGLISTPPGHYDKGSILFSGEDLRQKTERELQTIRGNKISMIFQDPMTALNPVLTIGQQITESLTLHRKLTKNEASLEAVEMLKLVGIPAPEERIKNYPHEFSGGMRQRAMIAMALACNPALLLADEPTTALDVTIQAQILSLLKKLQQEKDTAILFISHDLGAIARLCQRVLVMYAGKIIEAGTAMDIFHHPRHPYTWGLLQSIPKGKEGQKARLTGIMGQPPDLLSLPAGCAFHPRCAYAMKICTEAAPPQTKTTIDHSVSCWLEHPSAPKVDWRNS
jgi:oligopeptide transport system ATP-binding protein